MTARSRRPAASTTDLVPGRLVLVVGSSGDGTDTLIEAARRSLADNRRYVFPRRVATRPPNRGEDIVVADAAGFRAVAERGGFALVWEAQGHLWGVPSAMVVDLAAGCTVVVEVERTVIATARRRWPDVTVVEVGAPAPRVTADDRAVADVTIDDGVPRDTTVAALMAAILDA